MVIAFLKLKLYIYIRTFNILQLGNVEVYNDMNFYYHFHPWKRSSFPQQLSSLFTFLLYNSYFS